MKENLKSALETFSIEFRKTSGITLALLGQENSRYFLTVWTNHADPRLKPVPLVVSLFLLCSYSLLLI